MRINKRTSPQRNAVFLCVVPYCFLGFALVYLLNNLDRFFDVTTGVPRYSK